MKSAMTAIRSLFRKLLRVGLWRRRQTSASAGRVYSLDGLLAGMNAKNVHDEIKTGPAVGNEFTG